MGVPVVLATVAACGSIVTSIKSSWELRRMVKRKKEQHEADDEAPYVFRKLRQAYYDGLMTVPEYEQWYEKFLVAKVEKDLAGLRRIRAHLRIIENGAPITGNRRSRSVEPSRRRQSVTFAPTPQHPAYVDYRQPNRGNIEYYADPRARVGAHPDEFVRLERQSTYSRASSSDAQSRVSRSSSARHESRGRSRRRYDSSDSDSDDYYYEKRSYRGRSSNR
ncbi:uncharacterized protein PODANS_1_5660 [Podospora anserina S mat+]|uniref:Podospora anserina S mat+ genomic DNA chromosome 1, supercontig 1 n=4 Tax=Podospora TaxID=5144 RepID=B2AAZ5_PODAN|nr:uncharacterized protein PODANS_1_5660 [Podospora anserina S mat+]KAK4647922.1 hypothetical protein QC761_105660 [Podospora bellae-mahoneyi]KAK4672733.1 hypothetical protein QC763_105660 [Podospora pseudopauciseta]KAK4681232.1 hypothetical protein QC764_105660 [Podospora pseudoanserina]CAP60257.1 unnamed protein product [Podospora anserina S mat+]CDP22897.1 Putative protein of unknown function [Podospora anserina S mat+]